MSLRIPKNDEDGKKVLGELWDSGKIMSLRHPRNKMFIGAKDGKVAVRTDEGQLDACIGYFLNGEYTSRSIGVIIF